VICKDERLKLSPVVLPLHPLHCLKWTRIFGKVVVQIASEFQGNVVLCILSDERAPKILPPTVDHLHHQDDAELKVLVMLNFKHDT